MYDIHNINQSVNLAITFPTLWLMCLLIQAPISSSRRPARLAPETRNEMISKRCRLEGGSESIFTAYRRGDEVTRAPEARGTK